MIRNTEKKLYSIDKDENLDVSWMNINELIKMGNKNFLDRI